MALRQARRLGHALQRLPNRALVSLARGLRAHLHILITEGQNNMAFPLVQKAEADLDTALANKATTQAAAVDAAAALKTAKEADQNATSANATADDAIKTASAELTKAIVDTVANIENPPAPAPPATGPTPSTSPTFPPV